MRVDSVALIVQAVGTFWFNSRYKTYFVPVFYMYSINKNNTYDKTSGEKETSKSDRLTPGLLSVFVATLGYRHTERAPGQHGAGSSSSSDRGLRSAALSMRCYRQRMKQNPYLHAHYKQRQIPNQKRYLAKLRISDPYFVYEHKDNDVSELQQNTK